MQDINAVEHIEAPVCKVYYDWYLSIEGNLIE